MAGEYRLDKLRIAERAGRETLSPEDEAKVLRYRELKKKWDYATHGRNISAMNLMLDFFDGFRHLFEPAFWHYNVGSGEQEHKRLEQARLDTVEGQVELAQQEAGFFNDAYEVRKERLRKALEKIEGEEEPSASDMAEWRMALRSFNELVRDLNEGDLRDYAHAVEFRRTNEEWWGRSRAEDPLYPTERIEGLNVGDFETPPEDEEKLLAVLGGLPGGPEAVRLYRRLCDPELKEGTFFRAMSRYFNERTLKQPEPHGGDPRVISKNVSGTRWLQVVFYGNGRIQFFGRDGWESPEEDIGIDVPPGL